MCSGANGVGHVPCFMSLLIGEYYCDPKQSYGDFHGTKHVRILLIEMREEQICLFVLVGQKVVLS